MIFEWDENKAKSNIMKHKISFDEAKTVFYDFLSITIPDLNHSINEERFITIGNSSMNKLLVVMHTDKNDVIRIISSRLATYKERKYYEEEL